MLRLSLRARFKEIELPDIAEDEIDKMLNGICLNNKPKKIKPLERIKTCSICSNLYNEVLYENRLYFDKNICECDDCQLKRFNNNPLSENHLEILAQNYINYNDNGFTFGGLPSFVMNDSHREAISKRVSEILKKRQETKEAEEFKKYLEKSKDFIDTSIKESKSDMEFLEILIAKVLKEIDKNENKDFNKRFNI